MIFNHLAIFLSQNWRFFGVLFRKQQLCFCAKPNRDFQEAADDSVYTETHGRTRTISPTILASYSCSLSRTYNDGAVLLSRTIVFVIFVFICHNFFVKPFHLNVTVLAIRCWLSFFNFNHNWHRYTISED